MEGRAPYRSHSRGLSVPSELLSLPEMAMRKTWRTRIEILNHTGCRAHAQPANFSSRCRTWHWSRDNNGVCTMYDDSNLTICHPYVLAVESGISAVLFLLICSPVLICGLPQRIGRDWVVHGFSIFPGADRFLNSCGSLYIHKFCTSIPPPFVGTRTIRLCEVIYQLSWETRSSK